LPSLFDGDRQFRPNILADSATQTGAELTLRSSKPLSRMITAGLETSLDGSTGDFDYGRAAATARLFVTAGGPVSAALTIAAGTSTGDVPTQGRFYLGGPSSLRGYGGGVVSGSAFWLARAEIGNSLPAARLVAFTDLGWAGDRADFGAGRTLIGAGVGASFVDGLVRVDLARALRAPTGWRLDFYVDGAI
jgi:hemolysin activation/secretion protein